MRYPTALMTLTLAGIATTAHAQQLSPRFIRIDTAPKTIYYDQATGEYTRADPRGAPGSGPIWLANNNAPCVSSAVILVDDPDTDGDGISQENQSPCDPSPIGPCEGGAILDWGDIAPDTVVDRIVIQISSLVPDLDSALEFESDGVPGCDLFLTISDADDGRHSPSRRCITEILVPGVPGAVPFLGQLHFAQHTIVIDLAPSQVFELGDSDGIDDAGTGRSGAAIYGEPTFADLDSDGLHDFSYAWRFDQSALAPHERGAVGIISVAPKIGSRGDLPPHPADAHGLEDATDVYAAALNCPPDTGDYIGTFYVGGFECNPENPGSFTSFSSTYLELHGPNPALICGPADIAPPFGSLDFTDVITFLGAFANELYWVNALAPPSTFSASPDFNDVVVYLTIFAAGCP